MDKDLSPKQWVKLTAHERLLFKVSRSVRCVFMSLEPDGKLLFRAYFDRVPTSEDRELLSDALLETAFSFPEIHDHQLECLFSDEPFGELDKLDDWLFVRAEEAGDDLNCRVCGLMLSEPPWGEDGNSPSFDICDCCGVEFGYGDFTIAGTRNWRDGWLRKGAPWRQPKEKPQEWNLAEQLRQIPWRFV